MSFSVLNNPQSPEVHASTLLVAGNYLLSAWFGGTKEGHADTKIWLARRPLQDQHGWVAPEVVASSDGEAHWNPVLLSLPDENRIVLFYKVGSPISSWRTYIKDSFDDGRSWSQSRELVSGDRGNCVTSSGAPATDNCMFIGGRGPVKNKCIISSTGCVLAPASLETADGRWDCFCDISRDSCRTWTRSPLVKFDRQKLLGEGAIQPALIERRPGLLSMLTRSSTGHVLRADSEDGGGTWSELYEIELYNNNSGLDALRLSTGQWVVVHNPVNRNWV